MNDEQYKRFKTMQSQSIDCSIRARCPKGRLYFVIHGSSGSKYKVIITPRGSIFCSCPDMLKSKINECVCKHCLYVIFEDLELFDDVSHTFFERRYFTKDEMQNINRIMKSKKVAKLSKK